MATSTHNTRRQKGGLGGAFNRTQNPLKQANARIEKLEKELELAQHQADESPFGDARLISLDELRTDGDTQPRESMNPTTIEEYASRMRFDEEAGAILDPKGEAFPPILVFESEEGDRWLADGFHRVSAAREAGITRILARVEPGTRRDAFVRSLSVNAQHGLRRTNADKRRAVERALLDEHIVTYTDAWVAELCDVSRPFVSSQRKRLEREQIIAFQDRLLQQNGDWMEVMREPEEVEEDAQTPTPEKHARKAPSKHKKQTRGRATQATSTPASKRVDFGQDLSTVDAPSPSLVVAYPTRAEHFEQLVTAVGDTISCGRLLVLFPQSAPDGLSSLAKLEALSSERGFLPPRCVLVRPHDRHFVAFERDVERVNLVCDMNELGTPDLLIGVALDDWGM
jgi:biotin carboxyl carrier protein